MTPMEAAIKGAGEIGFTIVSISCLADRGVHPAAADGRHRRPAVPRIRHDGDASTIAGLGVRVADADADDVLALSAPRHQRGMAGSTASSRRCFDGMLAVLSAHAGCRAAPPASSRCWCSSRPSALTVDLFIVIPKGFFPPQDTGLIIGITEARAGRLVRGDGAPAAEARRHRVRRIPTRSAHVAASVGGVAAGSTSNNGRMFITLKPWDQRDGDVAAGDRPAAAEAAQVPGVQLFLQPAQDINVGGAARADAVPVHAAGREPGRAEHLGAEDAGADAGAADAARRRHRPADRRHDRDADDRSRRRRALRHPAAADRRHAVRRVRPAPGRRSISPS